MAAKRRPDRFFPLVLVALASGALFAGTAVYVANAPGVEPRSATPPPGRSSPAPKQPGEMTVLEPSYTKAGDLVLEPTVAKVPEGRDAMAAAIDAYLRKVPAVPAAARVLSVRVEGRTAFVDFSPEFEAGYGTEDERTVIEGVCATMGQFPTIDSVAFRIAGKPTAGIGNIDLSTPQPVIRVPAKKP